MDYYCFNLPICGAAFDLAPPSSEHKYKEEKIIGNYYVYEYNVDNTTEKGTPLIT